MSIKKKSRKFEIKHLNKRKKKRIKLNLLNLMQNRDIILIGKIKLLIHMIFKARNKDLFLKQNSKR